MKNIGFYLIIGLLGFIFFTAIAGVIHACLEIWVEIGSRWF